MDDKGNFSELERSLLALVQAHTLTVTANVTAVEARCQAMEVVMVEVLHSLAIPPFPVSELPDRIHRATVQRADAILAKMADESNRIASDVRILIDRSDYGPFPK